MIFRFYVSSLYDIISPSLCAALSAQYTTSHQARCVVENIHHVLIVLKRRNLVIISLRVRLFVCNLLYLSIEVLAFTWVLVEPEQDYCNHFSKNYNPPHTTNPPGRPTTTNVFQKTVTWKHFHDSNCRLRCLSGSSN